MERWEYKVTSLDMTMMTMTPRKESLAEMKSLGEEGWELVGIAPHAQSGGHTWTMTLVWKRKIEAGGR